MGYILILSSIIGIVATMSLNSYITPSVIEQKRIEKVDNRTVSNQELLKDAIIRYVKIKNEIPTMEKLKEANLFKDDNENNMFGGSYDFELNKEDGTLKIYTKINDDIASEYFKNNSNFKTPPKCTSDIIDGSCSGKEWETTYLLENNMSQSYLVEFAEKIDGVYSYDATAINNNYNATLVSNNYSATVVNHNYNATVLYSTQYNATLVSSLSHNEKKVGGQWTCNPGYTLCSDTTSDHGLLCYKNTWSCPSGGTPANDGCSSSVKCNKPVYYCPSGGTLSGTTCIGSSYSCPSGGTLSGATCTTSGKVCPTGYIDNGANCRK